MWPDTISGEPADPAGSWLPLLHPVDELGLKLAPAFLTVEGCILSVICAILRAGLEPMTGYGFCGTKEAVVIFVEATG